MEETQDWIEVTRDTLPEIGEAVLCYEDVKGMYVAKVAEIRITKNREGTNFSVDWIDATGHTCDPSHYCNLPERPN